MNFKQLTYFLAVAQEKQITSAAKKLYVSQPPLSYQLKQLEKELGVTLFKRTAHGVELTEPGRMLQQYAQKIVDLTQTAVDRIQKTARGELGHLSLGVVSSSLGLIPPKKFQAFKSDYPEISFDIHEDNTYGILDKLENQTIDLGIVRTPFNHNGLNDRTLTTEKMTAVLPSDSMFKNRQELDLTNLKGQSLIIYRRFEPLFNRSFAHAGIKPYYVVKVDDSRTAITWAQQGMGIALAPATIASAYARTKLLPIAHASWQTHLQLVWQKDKTMTPLMSKAIQLLQGIVTD